MSEDSRDYTIYRFFLHGRKRAIQTNVTLHQAQKHCQDPENSSRTCTSAAGKARTRKSGPWFDGYTNK